MIYTRANCVNVRWLHRMGYVLIAIIAEWQSQNLVQTHESAKPNGTHYLSMPAGRADREPKLDNGNANRKASNFRQCAGHVEIQWRVIRGLLRHATFAVLEAPFRRFVGQDAPAQAEHSKRPSPLGVLLLCVPRQPIGQAREKGALAERQPSESL